MATGKSIRVYDLAREVKQDTKRVMEDLRREGVDVSVPSNTVPHELAEKVRSKYFPKTEAPPKRGIKVIKKAAKPAAEEATPAEIEAPAAVEAAPVEEAPVEAPPVEVPPARAEEAPKPKVKTLAKKSVAKPEAEAPEAEAPAN